MKRPGCSFCECLSLEGATGDGSAGNCVAPVEIDDPAASSRVSKTPSASESLRGRLKQADACGGGDASPNDCRRSEAEEGFPCSKPRGIHKLKGRIAIVARVNGGAMLRVVMERGT